MKTNLILSPIILCLCHSGFAATLKVSPMRFTLNDKKKIAALEVVNQGNEAVAMQLGAVAWTQDEMAKDQYAPTKDLVFFPKIIKIRAKGHRVIRIGYRGPPAGAAERTYRLVLQELPVSRSRSMKLRMLLRMTLPIFIEPKKEDKRIEIGNITLSDRKLTAEVKNLGNRHYIVRQVVLQGLDGSGKTTFTKRVSGWYILHGITKTYIQKITREQSKNTMKVRVDVTAKDATAKSVSLTTTSNVDPAIYVGALTTQNQVGSNRETASGKGGPDMSSAQR